MVLQEYICPLCQGNGEMFHNGYFQKCSECQSVFRCSEYFLSTEKEKSRYEEHNNDVTDIRYQNFVMPIVKKVIQEYKPQDVGLDFGAGTGPVISHLLGQKGFHLSLYDPFFHNKSELLLQKYDYIIACEVVEHFHKPYEEFQRLYNLINSGGTLYIMTYLYSEDIDFKNWYYKNDTTHVFFYHKKSIEWICKTLGFTSHSIDDRLICLKKGNITEGL